MAVAGHVEDTVPYPESGQNEKSTTLIGMTTDQTRNRKQRQKVSGIGGKWMSTLKKKQKKKTFIVGVVLLVKWTLLFAHFLFNHHLSHVTTFCIKHE